MIVRKLGRRGLRRAACGLALVLAWLWLPNLEAQYERRTVLVERVIDGDTIEVEIEGGSQTLRLIGVDTPETKHPTWAVELFGAEASAYTTAALEGQSVQLEIDRTGDRRDRYGRWLPYVYVGGQNFNTRLIRDGYGYAIRGFEYSKRAEFIGLEAQARRACGGRGSRPPLPSGGPEGWLREGVSRRYRYRATAPCVAVAPAE